MGSTGTTLALRCALRPTESRDRPAENHRKRRSHYDMRPVEKRRKRPEDGTRDTQGYVLGADVIVCRHGWSAKPAFSSVYNGSAWLTDLSGLCGELHAWRDIVPGFDCIF